jgi:hypothetical protein
MRSVTGIAAWKERRSLTDVKSPWALSAATVHSSEHSMLDVILVAVALGFFALSIGYTIACDRL